MDGDGDAARRRAVLLTTCGTQTYALIKGLLSPVKPNVKSFDELAKLVAEHYKPTPSNTHQRRDGQSASEFVADLRSLSEHCGFGDRLGEMLRDFFVLDINDQLILRKLLSEIDPDLDSHQNCQRLHADRREPARDFFEKTHHATF